LLKEPFVPQVLIDRTEELINERQELGYLDVDEFVRDAVRRLLEKFERTLKRKSDEGNQ